MVGIERCGSEGDRPLLPDAGFLSTLNQALPQIFVLTSPLADMLSPYLFEPVNSKGMCHSPKPPELQRVPCSGLRCHPMHLHWPNNNGIEIIICINIKRLSSPLELSWMRSGTISSFSTVEPSIHCIHNPTHVEGAC